MSSVRLGVLPRGRNEARSNRSADVVELVGRHRVVTAQQVHALVAPPGSKITNTYSVLRALRREGLVETGPRNLFESGSWFVTEEGLRVACANAQLPRLAWLGDPHVSRGLIRHCWMVNEVGRLFVDAARERRDVCSWRSWSHQVGHQVDGGPLVVDGVLDYLTSDSGKVRSQTFFLEVDRFTQSYNQVLEQLHRYSRYVTHAPPVQPGRGSSVPFWRARYLSFPTVLFIVGEVDVDDEVQVHEARARVARVLRLAGRDQQISKQIRVLGATFADVSRYGVTGPVWRSTSFDGVRDCFGSIVRRPGVNSAHD
jgi:hypothetical protein